MGTQPMKSFSLLLESFFTQRLIAQRQVSSHTIASYRDTFRLLLQFAGRKLRKAPSGLELMDLDPPLIGAFLDELETERGNGARSRNLRLTAIRSFFRYAAFEEPAHSGLIQRVLAMPSKRYEKKLVGFLTRQEIDSLLAVPDRNLWAGRRDYAFLSVAIQTGLRVSEMIALSRDNVTTGTGAHVRCLGKGRKERCTPLNKTGSVGSPSLAARASSRHNGHRLYKCEGRQAQPGRRAIHPRQMHSSGSGALPIVEAQARKSACTAPHSGNGTLASRSGSISDCALARPRIY